MKQITGLDIQDMVRHWLAAPVYCYLGSAYGNDLKAILQHPQADHLADEQLAKLRNDIAALQALPASAVNIYAVKTPPDKIELVIEVSGRGIIYQESL